jgi:hypothetical protein
MFLRTGLSSSSFNQAFPGKGERLAPRDHVLISDKSIADSTEALIGLFLARSEAV